MTSTAWTKDRVATLTRLWAEGLSASEVARRLGGVSRNAVLGKLHRLGRLRSRPSAPRRAARVLPPPRARTAKMRAPRPSRAPVPVFAEPPPDMRLPLTALGPRRCRWPYGDPKARDFGFCGAHAAGGPYCPAHTAIAYAPAPVAGERRAAGGRRRP